MYSDKASSNITNCAICYSNDLMITLCLDAFVLEGREPSFLLSGSVFIMSGVMCRMHHPRFKIITIALRGRDGVQRHSCTSQEVYGETWLILPKYSPN